MANKGVALVAGVGSGLGFGICRRFAAAGYDVAMVSRKRERLEPLAERINQDGNSRAHVCPADVRDEAAVEALFDRVESDHGPIAAAVFNTGAQYRQHFLDIPADLFEKVWRLGCYAGFLVGRAAARRMVPRGEGSILFTGATASIRGSAEFAGFAASKSGLRAMAQSMARELGPQGIHVAHVVVDGLIDSPVIRERFADVIASLPEDGALSPEAIGQAYVDLHHQHRSAWSFEIDLRPWSEKF
ncbi:MAG: SDR family NAD(P)-dependent oxidoreductase [Alphaproteobacteria bacterium]|nr:MAG: SDR family NAD(P)-dependent oxidoreductase [Alphaproteobacteria bacterium]